MKLPRTKIWEAAATDKERPTLTNVHYNVEKKRLEAADGFILAVCPVEPDNKDKGGIVPVDVIKGAMKASTRKGKVPTMTETVEGFIAGVANNGTESIVGNSYLPVEGQFPDVDAITPKGEPEYVMTIDAELLYRLAMAICEDKSGGNKPLLHVRLYKYSHTSPIRVEPGPQRLNRENWGLIMPISDGEKQGH